VCHAALVSGGYSPALGFVHTGKQLSFVYDVADLYKVEITVPAAFRTVAESTHNLESRVRRNCREAFKRARLLERILPDVDRLLDISPEAEAARETDPDDDAKPEDWWTPPNTFDMNDMEAADDGDDS
jgi:CRISPR-associated protein Cas1